MDADMPLERRGSQDTPESLLRLDPEPIDTPSPTDYENLELSSVLEESLEGSVGALDALNVLKGTTTSALGLSGSSGSSSDGTAAKGPGAIFYLMRIQKFSSYAMAFFTSLHLVNVSLIPAVTQSVSGSETYLLMTREIYQTSLTEPILVALPVVAHVGSGILLRFLRRRQNMKRYGGGASRWPPLSWISVTGYVLSAFYSAHVFVNRLLPLEIEGDSANIDLAYVAHGFARHPLIAYAAYVGLLATGCGHMIWGQAKWLGLAPSTKGWHGREGAALDKRTKRHRRRQWLGLQGAAVAFAGLWAVGGLGVVARGGLTDGWIGKVYDDMFAALGL